MKNKNQVITLPTNEIRIAPVTADGFNCTISGTAIVFGVRSVNLGGFEERVNSTAVTKTLSGKPDIRLLNNHNSSQILARTTSGNLQLSTDSKGVNFTALIDTRSSYANDLAISLERGDTGNCSFCFRCNRDSWKDENGVLVRTLEDISVSELSIVGDPAYVQSSSSIRSCPAELRSLLTRSLDNDDEDDEDDDCDCDCPECLAGDCADCSDPDCDDSNCEHGDDSARSLDLWKLEMRIAIANRL
jgi:HK97 family phage prohead protease